MSNRPGTVIRLARGLAAGATGTIALELTSYLDMVVRGRPASDQPQRLGEALVSRLRLPVSEGEDATSRGSALGSAIGYVDGLTLPMLYASVADEADGAVILPTLALSAGAMLGSNALPIALGVTDPRRWSAEDWLTDLVPHLAYGFVAVMTYRLLNARR